MTPKYKRGDKRKTIRAKKLSKKTKLYKNCIESVLGKTFGQFEVKRFHDVEGGKYRFLCKCLKCNKNVYLHGTRLKHNSCICTHCHVINYGPRRKYKRGPYGRRAPYSKRGPYKKKEIEIVKIKESCSLLKILAVVFVYSTLKDIITYIFELYGLI